MIAKLNGLVDSLGDDWVVVDVNGVGYVLFCPARVLSRLPAVGEAVALFVETHVREDHIHLYGFLESAEREWFRVLSTVQGVGTKVALSILSVLAAGQIGQAIAAGDKASFTRASGVGPKLAARICSELKDKAAAMGAVPTGAAARRGAAAGAPAAASAAASATGDPSGVDGGDDAAVADAVSALVNLGYGQGDAYAAASRAAADGAKGVQALIGAALKDLGRGLG